MIEAKTYDSGQNCGDFGEISSRITSARLRERDLRFETDQNCGDFGGVLETEIFCQEPQLKGKIYEMTSTAESKLITHKKQAALLVGGVVLGAAMGGVAVEKFRQSRHR